MHVRQAVLPVALLGVAVLVAAQSVAPPGSTARPGPATTQPQERGTRGRDSGQRPKGTAQLLGSVVAADTGSPLRRAQVRLTMPEQRDARVTSSDASGRFQFRDLPAGRYQLSASKTGFVSLSFGQRQPADPSRSVQLSEGEARKDITLALPRAGVITGRLLDEFGEPVPDAMVQAYRFQFARGRRRLVPAGRFAPSNDIGVYRVYGLAPGEYFVSASSRGVGMGPDRTDEAVGFAPTYYPGTISASEAQPISVAVGQEVTADFQLIPARLSRVSGSALDSTGRPLGSGSVMLVQQIEGGTATTFGSNGGRIQDDGSFTINAVPPGTYTLTASTSARRGFGGPAEDVERGSLPLTVYGEDVDNVVIQTSRGQPIRGRIATDGGATAFSPQQVRLQLDSPDQDDGPMSFSGRAEVRDDGTFEIIGYPGKRILRVTSVPDGWQLRSVQLGSEDVTDGGFEVKAGQSLPAMRVVLTAQVTEVSGTVSDSRGDPVRDFTVVVFPEDVALWEAPSGRYVRWARSDQDGRYRVDGLPPGEYLAVAAESIEDPRSLGPDAFASLRALASPLRLGDGERKVVPLKLAAP